MSERLQETLRAAGFPCAVESHERLAIVIPEGSGHSAAANRRRIVDLAREAGFTHVAVELDPHGETVPRD